MPITLSTRNGPLNFANNSYYWIVGFSQGAPIQETIFIEPPISGVVIEPTLVAAIDKKTQCTISIAVKGTSASNLQTRVQSVITEFLTANQITFSLNGATARTFDTYPTAIEPPDLGERDTLFVANSQFLLPNWTFSIHRSAVTTGGTRFGV